MAKMFQVQVPMKDRKTGKQMMRTRSTRCGLRAAGRRCCIRVREIARFAAFRRGGLARSGGCLGPPRIAGRAEAGQRLGGPFQAGRQAGRRRRQFLRADLRQPLPGTSLNLYLKDQQYYIKGKITNVGKKGMASGTGLFLGPGAAGREGVAGGAADRGRCRRGGRELDIKETQLDLALNPAGLFGLEQILEPRTVPIRRIDDIVLYFHSHRTYDPILLAARQFGGKPKKPEPSGNPLSAAASARNQTAARAAEHHAKWSYQTALPRRDCPGPPDAAGPGDDRRESPHRRKW